ncbi:MAG: dGTPase [Campylobacterota bacterium]
MIDYKKKITTHREFYPIDDISISYESDRGRIFSAPALRRLQKKTQVFPLELNAAVRSRLTHSLEVSQTARFISKTILKKLDKKYGLDLLDDAFISTAEMSSLLHDIGNPPFGHFAEDAINDWMRRNAVKIFDCMIDIETKDEKRLKTILIEDICNYDGNAQAIRVVTKLQRLNLSYTQIASILKYSRVAHENRPDKSEPLSYLMKKPGYYYSEKDIVNKICKALEIKPGCRFPITYIMEAADDISYLNADMEDAVDKGILRFEDIYKLIKQECETMEETYLSDLVEQFYNKALEKEDEPYQFNLFLTLTRAKLTRELVEHVANIYVQNHEEIFNGVFNNALLEYDKNSKYTKAIKVLQNISKKYIYTNKDKQTLELKGHKILTSLLDNYSVLLNLSCKEFEALIEDKTISCFLSQRLIKRVSSKQIVAYKHSISQIEYKKYSNKYLLEELYYRVRLVIDYISGMTDDFALDEYKKLNALI